MEVAPRKVTLVADELLGYTRTGGIGTATSFLAIALARVGHEVDVLYCADPPSTPMDAEWADTYARFGIATRLVPRSDRVVEPSYFARMLDVEDALASDPPDIAVVQDLAAPAYTALRTRHLGLRFEETLFVVYCHGTRRWITDAARKVRVLPGAHAVTILEQASIELADVVVSPSRYLIDWMERERWNLPARSVVIPHLTRSIATGEPQQRVEPSGDRVRRVAFFGRLEDRKGIGVFIEGLNLLPSELLQRLEIEFIGRPTPAWPPGRVGAALSQRVASVTFEPDLDQSEAIERLARPGTLAVMPSFEETYGNTVRECLDHGIPFIASDAAAIRELVAQRDHERVLFTPTAPGMAAALRRALGAADALRPAHAAFDSADSLPLWEQVLATNAAKPQPESPDAQPAIDVVVVHRRSREDLRRCLAGLERQTYPNMGVIVASSRPTEDSLPRVKGRSPLVVHSERPAVDSARHQGLAAGVAPFVVFVDEEDEPEEELLSTLVAAQRRSDADIVSCGLRLVGQQPRLFLFHGDPGGLGLLANSYGTVALLRRTLIDTVTTRWPVEGDADWPLLARLRMDGARIVSVPLPLVTRSASPGNIHAHPSDALLVVDEFERALPRSARGLARLTAGLAAAASPRGTTVDRRRGASRRRLIWRRA